MNTLPESPTTLERELATHPARRENPWLFVPSLTLFQAIVNGFASILPGIVLKSLGASNELVGLSTLLFLPVALRSLVAPWVDGHSTKRKWTDVTQGILVIVMVATAAIAFAGEAHLGPLILAFLAISMVSALFDIAGDGIFLLSLTSDEQAFFVGIKTACYRLANILINGGFVTLAGFLALRHNSVPTGWGLTFAMLSVLCLVIWLYHKRALPRPALDRPLRLEGSHKRLPYLKVFREFFTQHRAWAIVIFIFIYRLGEGLLDKMKVPFMLDPIEKGGMNMNLAQVGFMQGTISTVAMIAGGLGGAWMVKRFSLRKTILPFALCMVTPSAVFALFAANRIHTTWEIGIFLINPWMLGLLVLEAFGYGIGFASYVYFQCEICKGPFQTSFFAIAAGLMSLGYILPGTLSGLLQSAVGYPALFVFSVLFSLPGIALIFFLPLRELEDINRAEDLRKTASPSAEDSH